MYTAAVYKMGLEAVEKPHRGTRLCQRPAELPSHKAPLWYAAPYMQSHRADRRTASPGRRVERAAVTGGNAQGGSSARRKVEVGGWACVRRSN